MNRKVILLNLVLIALAGVCFNQLRLKRRESAAHEQTVLSRAPHPPAVVAPPLAVPVRPPMPAEYMEVAQKTLFAKDRNPNVVVQAPPPPPPPPPMPQLPTYSGQMALGEPVIFLTLGGVEQKGYRAGDEIGPFTLVSFNRDRVTFEWDGKTVEREVSELKPKEIAPGPAVQNSVPTAGVPAPGAATGAGGGGSTITSLASASAANAGSNSDNKGPSLGNDMGGGYRGCAAGDSSPAGTVLSGYRKVVSQGLMGASCHWEQIK
ncbi:MAG TPA: hypothetical protein VN841_25220 [Bryobacteraceae bacterium]|nr:hypothetical protein [Bryobacteraceae bacterium]